MERPSTEQETSPATSTETRWWHGLSREEKWEAMGSWRFRLQRLSRSQRRAFAMEEKRFRKEVSDGTAVVFSTKHRPTSP